MWQTHQPCGQRQFHNLILFVIRSTAHFVLSEAEWKGASDISPEPHISTPPRLLMPTSLKIDTTSILKNIARYYNMDSSDMIRRDPQWVSDDTSIESESPASNRDAAQNSPIEGREAPIRLIAPWRESQWRTYLAFNYADEMLKMLYRTSHR